MLQATRGCKSSKPGETPLKWDPQRGKEQTGDPFSVGAGSLQLLLTTSPGTPGLDLGMLTRPQLTDHKHARRSPALGLTHYCEAHSGNSSSHLKIQQWD